MNLPDIYRNLVKNERNPYAWLDKRLNAKVERLGRARFPKKKLPAQPKSYELMRAFPDIYRVECARFTQTFNLITAAREEKASYFYDLFLKAIEGVEPEKTETEILAHSGSSGDFWTQGLGASSYARNAAEAVKMNLEMNGVECRIEESNIQWIAGADHRDFRVFAKTNKMGLRICDARRPSLVESVRWMWSRAINPRVHYPFLPWGFEERHGISFSA